MSIMEICLLVIGVIVFVISFLIPDKKSSGISGEDKKLGTDQIQKIIDEQMKVSKKKLEGVVDETLDYAVEKTERAVERISNEKIMAVNEYSDTVLEEINKNHKEVMFLYDMLNDKHKNIKNTAKEVDKTVKAAEEKAKETQERLQSVHKQVEETTKAKTAIDILREHAASTEASAVHVSTQEQNAVEAIRQNKPVKTAAEQMIEVLGAKKITPEQVQPSFAPLTPKKVTKQEHVLDTFEETIEQQEAEEKEIQQFETLSNNVQTPAPEPVVMQEHGKDSERVPDMNIQFAPGVENGRNNNERVLALYKEGKSNIAIAKELGMGVGEVNLVINLFKGSH